MTRPLSRWIVGLSVAGAILAGLFAFRAVFPGLQAKTDRIQLEVSAIRGLPFEHRVEAGRESNAEFRAFVDRRLRKHPMPPHYGIVVRAVGLYRGPVITDPEGLLKDTVTTAGGGYYDVDRRKFFLLRETPEPRLSSALAHELHHALQDQHFGIERYLAPPDPLNGDEQVARRAVLEGEAAYVQFMYTLKTTNGRMPTHKLLGEFIRAQPENSHAIVRATIKQQPHLAKTVGDETAAALESVDDLPPFIWDLSPRIASPDLLPARTRCLSRNVTCRGERARHGLARKTLHVASMSILDLGPRSGFGNRLRGASGNKIT